MTQEVILHVHHKPVFDFINLNKRHPSRLSRNYLNLNFLIIGRHENIKMEQLI